MNVMTKKSSSSKHMNSKIRTGIRITMRRCNGGIKPQKDMAFIKQPMMQKLGCNLVGGLFTPLKNDGVRQLG